MSDLISNQIVAADTRPNGDIECFYCKQKVGHSHSVDCVVPTKRICVRAVFEYECDVPACFDEGLIDFSLNESSSCADNELEKIAAFGDSKGCLCAFAKFTYLGPATPS